MSVVLEGSKEDDEKWKRFSRQIVDVVFPQLSKLQVKFCVKIVQMFLPLESLYKSLKFLISLVYFDDFL